MCVVCGACGKGMCMWVYVCMVCSSGITWVHICICICISIYVCTYVLCYMCSAYICICDRQLYNYMNVLVYRCNVIYINVIYNYM